MPGKVISLEGDTSDYLILFEDKFRNPDVILYKKEEGDEGKYFAPEDVKGFEIEGREFVSTIAELEISPCKDSGLNSKAEFRIIKDTVFLQKLISGDKSLFYHRSLSGNANFYIENNGNYELLKHKRFLRGTRVLENKAYSVQLIKYLEDCPDLLKNIQSVKYEQRDLVKLFKAYFKCKNTEPSYNYDRKKILLKFNLYAGITSTRLNFESASAAAFHLTKADNNSSIDFTGGLGMDIILPLNKYRWSVNTELLYTNYKIEGNYVHQPYDGLTIENDTSFEVSHVAFNYMLRYSLPIKKATLFANFGFFIAANLNENDTNVKSVNLSGDITTTEGFILGDLIRQHEKGSSIGLGARYKNFSFEIRSTEGKDMIKSLAIGGYTNRYSFLAGYRF